MKKKKIIITGGHLTPALAVIDQLVKGGDWEIHFIGRRYASEREKTPSMESKIITGRGIWFYPLTAGRFPRLLNRYAFLSALKLPTGFFQSLYYLIKLRPKVILSFGGYLSVPVVFWGWVLGIPSLTHEQTTVKSLATKINSLFVKKIALSWPQTLKDHPAEKSILTGNPVRNDIFEYQEKYWRVLRFSSKIPFVFITGGNQGSHAINMAVKEILPAFLKLANVFHQCGHLESLGDFEALEEAREALPLSLKKRYHVRKFLDGREMGTFIKKADLVVSRAGANTITEIAALGKPALLIPMPWNFKDEQNANAVMLKELGLAEIVPQVGFDLSHQAVLDQITKMLKNIKNYEKNAPAAKKLVKLDAAERIVQQLEALV